MPNDLTLCVKLDLKALMHGKEDALKIIDGIPDKKDIPVGLNGKDKLMEDVAHITLAFNGLTTIARNIGSAFNSFITATNIQEKAVAGLSAALTANGENAATATKAYEKLATQIQRTTTVGDEAVLQLATEAVNLGIVNSKREEAIQGAIGLSKAYGIDLHSAMKGIALAYEGEFSLLSRQIPALRTAQTETEKMAVLNEAMAKGFAIAKAETDTAAGAMAQYQNLVGDLKEVIGEMIVTALLPAVKALSEVVAFLTKYKVALTPVIVAIGAFTAAMTKSLIVKAADLVATSALTIKTWAFTVAVKAKAAALWIANVAVTAWNALVAITSSLITAATYKLGFMSAALTVVAAKVAVATAGISLLIGGIALLVSKVNSAGKDMQQGSQDMVQAVNDVITAGKDKLVQIDIDYNKKRLDLYMAAEYEKVKQDDGTTKFIMKNKDKLITAENVLYAQQAKERARILKEDHDAAVIAAQQKIELGEATTDLLLQIHNDYLAKTKSDLDKWGAYEKEAHQATIRSIQVAQKQTQEAIAKTAEEALQKQLDAHTKSISLTEKKIALGRDTYDTLKQQVDDYVAFTKKAYGEESDAYLTALQKQQALATEMGKAHADLQKSLEDYVKATRTQRQVLLDTQADSLAMQDKYYDQGLIDYDTWYENCIAINDKYTTDTLDLTEKELANALSVAQRKVAIGEASTSELQAAQEAYYTFVSRYYQHDSDAYLRAMEQKKQAERDYIALQRETADVLFELQNKNLALYDPELARLQEQQRAVEKYYEDHIDTLRQAGLEEVDIEAMKKEALLKLEEDYNQANIELTRGGLATIAAALEKSGKAGFEVAKAFRIADVIMTTPSAAMKSYDSLAVIPVVGPALGMAAFASTIALGAMQIAEIGKAKPPKAEKGGWQGLMKGPSHAQGGMVIEIEGDEYITNKKRVRELGTGFFDFINFAPLNAVKNWMQTSIPKFATGGIVSPIPPLATYNFPLTTYNSFNTRGIETRLDEMSDRLAYGLQQIEQKSYEVNVRTQMKGIKFIQELEKITATYKRRTG